MPDVNTSSPAEKELYANLGRQLAPVQDMAASHYGLVAPSRGGFDSIIDYTGIGQEYFNRIDRAAYKAICDGSPAWKAITDKTTDALVTAFTGLLISGLAILAPVAGAVASLIVGIFFDAAKGELCDLWHKSLPSAPAPSGSGG